MRKFFVLLLQLGSFTLLFAQTDWAKQYAEEIKPESLKENLTIIASDAMEGRRTGSRGQKMAAAFIAYQFKEMGLSSPPNLNYYQPVELFSSSPEEVYVKVGGQRYDNFTSFFYNGSIETTGEVQEEVIFLGHVGNEELKNIDVVGKSVFVVIPSTVSNTKIVTTIRPLRDRGAKNVFVVTDGANDFRTILAYKKDDILAGSLSLEKGNNKDYFLMDQSLAEKMFNTPFAKLISTEPAKLKKIKPAKISYRVTMKNKAVMSENVLGYLEGTDKKDEVVIVTAHYDHIGKTIGATGDVINNGADDDGSGTVAVLELAKTFAKAKAEGRGPRRSILFMTVTGEENGLLGSEYYVKHPVFPLEKTVADLNIDMIGRRDDAHKGKPDYVYVIGSDKLSSELHEIHERNNATHTKLELDYTYNDDKHPLALYRRSDHWNFAKNNIPIVFLFDGVHEDYHKVSDEVSKIEFDLLTKRAKAMFFTAWEIANRDNRLVKDVE